MLIANTCSGRKLSDLEYANDLALLSENPDKLQTFLHRQNDSVAMSGMHFALSATAVFQQIDTMLGGLSFAMACTDDIDIASMSQTENLLSLNKVPNRTRQFDFRCTHFSQGI